MKKDKTSKAPDAYARVITAATGAECVAEHRFHPSRRWRFDYALPEAKVAIEIDGGVWTYGRHNRAAGYIADMEKLNAAAVLGWRVLRFTPDQQWTAAAIAAIAEAARRGAPAGQKFTSANQNFESAIQNPTSAIQKSGPPIQTIGLPAQDNGPPG